MSRVNTKGLVEDILNLVPESHRKGACVSISRGVRVIIPIDRITSRASCWGMSGISMKRGKLTISGTHIDIESKVREVAQRLLVA